MGTSRRYAHVVDAQMDARIAERVMRSGEPETLTDREMQLETFPITRAPRAPTGRSRLMRRWSHGLTGLRR